MEVDVDELVPGMILEKDLLGKSGKPIVEKNTKLTATHIDFINKFLFEKVSITSSVSRSMEMTDNDKRTIPPLKADQVFVKEYKKFIIEYKKLFTTWQNNVPFQIYTIRKLGIPLFEKAVDMPISVLLSMLPVEEHQDYFFYHSCTLGVLSASLAFHLHYEKKDWLQIGFAALLSDCGIAKMNPLHIERKGSEKEWQLHPVYSYKMIKDEPTLRTEAKIAVLQHHEFLDGSGFPTQAKEEKIQNYARIITVCDYVLSIYPNSDMTEVTQELIKIKGTKLDPHIVDKLVSEWSSS